MPSEENVVTLSIGRTANFVSQHYWNTENARLSDQGKSDTQPQWSGNFREVRSISSNDTRMLVPRHIVMNFASDNGPTPWNELDVSQVIPQNSLGYDVSYLATDSICGLSSSFGSIYKPFKRDLSYYHRLKRHGLNKKKGPSNDNNKRSNEDDIEILKEIQTSEYSRKGTEFIGVYSSLKDKEAKENFGEDIGNIRCDYYSLTSQGKEKTAQSNKNSIKDENNNNNDKNGSVRGAFDKFATDYAEIDPCDHSNLISIRDWGIPEYITPVLGTVMPRHHPFESSKYAQRQLQSIRRNNSALSISNSILEVPKAKIEEELYEDIRKELEACNGCGLFQIFTTGDDCWSSVATKCVEELIDNFSDRAQILLYDIDDHFQDDRVDIRPSVRALNRALMYSKLSIISDNLTLVPITTRWSQRSDWELGKPGIELQRSEYNCFSDNIYTASSVLGIAASGLSSSVLNEGHKLSSILAGLSPFPQMNVYELTGGFSLAHTDGRVNSEAIDKSISLSFSAEARSYEFTGKNLETTLSPGYCYSWLSSTFRSRLRTQNGSRTILDGISTGHKSWMQSWRSFIPQPARSIFMGNDARVLAFTDVSQKLPDSFPHIFMPYGTTTFRYRDSIRAGYDLRASPDLRVVLRNEKRGFGFGTLYKNEKCITNEDADSEDIVNAYEHSLALYSAYNIPGITRVRGDQAKILDTPIQWDPEFQGLANIELLDESEFGPKNSSSYRAELRKRIDARAIAKILCNEKGMTREEIEENEDTDSEEIFSDD